MVQLITILGAVGGAGSTTVAAHLTAALSKAGYPVLGLDLCPENRLRLHFGMPLGDRSGWAKSLVDSGERSREVFRSSAGVDIVPFGELGSDAQLDKLLRYLGIHPTWLQEELSSTRFKDDTIVVCDCPRLVPVFRRQALPMSDLVLIVTTTDSASYSIATGIVHGVEQGDGPDTLLVMNGFDSTRQLDRDVSLLMHTRHKNHFLPVPIHRDENVRECLAYKQTVLDFAPFSQAAHDMKALACAVSMRLGGGIRGVQ